MQAFNSALTCCFAVIFLDMRVSIPMGIVVSLADLANFEALGGKVTSLGIQIRFFGLLKVIVVNFGLTRRFNSRICILYDFLFLLVKSKDF